VHPGGINTNLSRFMSEDEKRAYTRPLKTTEQGAATSVCATSPQLDGKGGVYCLYCDITEVIELQALEGLHQVLKGVIPWTIDPDWGGHRIENVPQIGISGVSI
jgi:hypothetical protein